MTPAKLTNSSTPSAASAGAACGANRPTAAGLSCQIFLLSSFKDYHDTPDLKDVMSSGLLSLPRDGLRCLPGNSMPGAMPRA